MKKQRITLPGSPFPMGVVIDKDGAQFSIFSRHSTGVILVLFRSAESDSKFEEIELNPLINRTGDIWHIWVEGIKEGQLYGYRINGPYEPEKGHKYNINELLLDPYAKAVSGSFKCIAVKTENDWLDRPLNTNLQDTIIYELHVRGFTCDDSSHVKSSGTYKGIIEKIGHLQELGITAVELMPIQEFDENENVNTNPTSGERLKNYWGYSTISFFAPKGGYSSSGSMGKQVQEFKEMVRCLHNAGIEVILDVVFNHTAEGDHKGPTLCFRGIDNSIYYILEDDRNFYKNFSGCGNTFNCNHPLVRDFIIDCLKYWVIEMHIDGFRFDLASILGRDQDGSILSNPPLIERISEDPILRNTKIIAEAWDAAGAYQVGDFPGRWAEWNGRYRDDVRRFWRGDRNTAGAFATRLTGSSDLFGDDNRTPLHSINFITCHDGFTLNDLVSFNKKHNLENGEDNRDGDNNNLSCNYGFEGLDADPDIENIRVRQIKNFIATLFLSQGVPMMLAGDEFRRTQNGNNNAYCQDNITSWINWTHLSRYNEIFRFCREMISFRKEHPILRKKTFFTGKPSEKHGSPDIVWHGKKAGKPDWSSDNHCIACLLNGEYAIEETGKADIDIYMAFNASRSDYNFELPESPSGKKWMIKIDTAKSSPQDIANREKEIILKKKIYTVKSLSTVVLIT